ncbi:MAG TPA: MmgE/PrpD family protein [bacterium]|nr:MmgE/PrpD family protein [bacterium]
MRVQATETLARYASTLQYQAIPPAVVARTKEVVLDCLGTLLGGSVYPVGTITLRFVARVGEGGACTVVGTDRKASPVTAAFANATISHCLELDDNYNPANAHVANVVVPAALAVAEQEHVDGRQLIAALVAAYDVEGRIGIALSPVRLYERSFHPSSINGNFGAAAAAARAMALGPSETVNALGLAGCQASGLLAWVTEPAQFSKAFQIGVASRNGVTAAEIARLGFTGPPHILEGKHNPFRAFAGVDVLSVEDALTGELGDRFEIARTSLKKYACCRQIHAPLDGLFKIMARQDLRGDDIVELTTRVATSMADIIDNNELPSHNAQYILAMAAYDGRVEVEQLTGDRAADPRISALSKRVRVLGDDALEQRFPEQWSAVTTVRAGDGREFTEAVYYPTGDPENPLTADDLRAKFFALATKAISRKRADAIADLVTGLDALSDVSQLARLLSADR